MFSLAAVSVNYFSFFYLFLTTGVFLDLWSVGINVPLGPAISQDFSLQVTLQKGMRVCVCVSGMCPRMYSPRKINLFPAALLQQQN